MMALLGKLARVAYKMTPARKRALQKAVAASAKKRAKKGGSKLIKKVSTKGVSKSARASIAKAKGGSRIKLSSRDFNKLAKRSGNVKKAKAPTKKATARLAAIKKTDSMKLTRVKKGTTAAGQKRISSSNFTGKKGKALKKATYKDRLASSRAKYKNTSLKNKLGQKAIGLTTPTGVWRRKYVDLTTGENVRRNLSRNLKVAGVTVAGYGGLSQTDTDVGRALRNAYGIPKL